MYCIILFKTFIFDLIEHHKQKKNMKSLLIALFLTAAVGTMSYAQCDKKVSLTSSKTQHLDAAGTLKHADDEKTTVVFDKSDIIVSISGENGDQQMTGKVKSATCDWKVPFKEGKTTLNITLTHEGNGESREFTVIIEGKDGKIS